MHSCHLESGQSNPQMVLQSLGIGSASEDLLAGLLIQTLDTYLVTDQRGEITYVSPAADRTLFTSGQALKGQMITQWMPPDQWPSVHQLLDKLTRDSSLVVRVLLSSSMPTARMVLCWVVITTA